MFCRRKIKGNWSGNGNEHRGTETNMCIRNGNFIALHSGFLIPATTII